MNDDIKAHSNELRAVANLGHRVQEEIRNVSQELNSMRAGPGRQQSLELKDSEIRDVVAELTSNYQNLSKKSDDLVSIVHSIGKNQADFESAQKSAESWLSSVERKASDCANTPISPDSVQLRQKLADVKDLLTELAAQQNLIDRVKFTGEQLTSALSGTDAYETEKRHVDAVCSSLTNR